MCSQCDKRIQIAPSTKKPLNCAQDNESMLAPKPCQETKLPSHHNSLNNPLSSLLGTDFVLVNLNIVVVAVVTSDSSVT